jgi:hypothetical protein
VLEIRHLKTLHALREADSLVDAADRLHLTQSALSHQFKELEERMGMPLFVRKTKPVRFTSAGCACCNWPTPPCRCCVAPNATSRGWPAAPPDACTWRSSATVASSG